jgi:hypothetical protein
MLRIQISLVITIALACSAAGRASADFIELPASDLAAAADTGRVSPSARELQLESGYLELGYYAVHGATVQKELARPTDAGLGDSVGSFASLWPAGVRGVPSLLVLVSGLCLLLVAMAVVVARRPRRV